jgi:hypothetical protein
MVVLARAVGLPARMVIGYASGDYDAPTAEYIIRQEDAHSWAEVYFSGIGWVEFEPTAGLPAIDRTDDANASAPPPSLPTTKPVFSWLKTSWRVLLSSLGGQLLIAFIGFVSLFSLWQVGEMGYLYLLPSHKAISRMYARMERSSARLLPNLTDGHTPHQFGDALKQVLRSAKNSMLKQVFSPVEAEIDDMVTLYEKQIFSAHSPTKLQTNKGIRAWMRLRWRLWLANRWKRFT